jgi:hypothetical protein
MVVSASFTTHIAGSASGKACAGMEDGSATAASAAANIFLEIMLFPFTPKACATSA